MVCGIIIFLPIMVNFIYHMLSFDKGKWEKIKFENVDFFLLLIVFWHLWCFFNLPRLKCGLCLSPLYMLFFVKITLDFYYSSMTFQIWFCSVINVSFCNSINLGFTNAISYNKVGNVSLRTTEQLFSIIGEQ